MLIHVTPPTREFKCAAPLVSLIEPYGLNFPAQGGPTESPGSATKRIPATRPQSFVIAALCAPVGWLNDV